MKSNHRYRFLLAVWMLAAILIAPLLAFTDDTPSTSANSIAAVLQPFVEHHALAGAVTLVADEDKVLSLEATGFADIAAKKPMRTDGVFWIASQTKPITAAALMMLVDEGKVKLDDPVEKYLPEFKGQWVRTYEDKEVQLLKKPKHPITVRNILNHTSGLPFIAPLEQPTLDLLPLHLAVKSYALSPLLFEPDTRWSYSNTGINTAGRIIEVVSGMPYEKFMDERLFEPLGMKDTTFWPNEGQLKRLAKAYKPNKDKNDLVETKIHFLKYPLNERDRYAMPGGGLFSTAADVARFCQMVLNGGIYHDKRYLSEEAVRTMTSKQTKALSVGYGLGWATNNGVFGHGGAYGTNMTIDPDRRLILVFMVQHNGFPKDGGKSHEAFQKASRQRFGNSKR